MYLRKKGEEKNKAIRHASIEVETLDVVLKKVKELI
jgi:hypothetical protein